ncbi:MAG: protein kinase [Blastocatellia bacterium]|nr:protein kinase [Blastocatellia bacterium]
MIGETISHYRILERIGAGGMGEVYKAEDLRLHRPVALKMMFVDGRRSGPEAEARSRFLREARAASALNHPNIATVYEIDEVVRDGSRYSFIVMEFIPGSTLKDPGRKFSLAEIVDIVKQIADALAESHEHGIIHRDIKPSNIIITEQGRVKILDFGVAKYNPLPDEEAETVSLYSTELIKTTPGTVVGTFAYMSPEQALGKEVDGRSDIFSLGVLFYEMIAGRQPFTGSSALAVVDAILHADVLPLSSFNFKVTGDLERVTQRMLEKDKMRRYQTMREVFRDLDAVQRGLSLERDPYETNQTVLFPPASMGSNTLKNRLGQSIAVMSFNNVTKNSDDRWIGTGIAETVTADLKKIEGITVIGRERVYELLRRWSVEQDEEIDETLATSIGREIGARWIVCGGYQKIGEMLRITARFVEVDTGEVIKTVKIDGQMKEIFDLQDKIVYELSRDLDLSLHSGERQRIEQKETNVVEAYEAFVKADIELDKGSRESVDAAISLFERAIGLDPGYAHAYAGLGYAIALKGHAQTKPEFLEQAVGYLQKAIELNPLLPDGYSGLGFTFVAMGREDDAIGALRRALSFAPQDPLTHSALGRAYMIGKGMFREAVAEFKLALKLNPEAGWVAQQLSLCCSYVGDYECGMEAARKAIDAQEQYISGQTGIQLVGSFVRLAHIHILKGAYDDAIAECYRELVFLRQSNHALKERAMIEVNQKLVSAYVRQGNLEDARKVFDQLIKSFDARLAEGADDPFTRYYVACACAMIGEKDNALEHLQIAIAGRRNYNATRAKTELDFESLRNDDRFKALVGTR